MINNFEVFVWKTRRGFWNARVRVGDEVRYTGECWQPLALFGRIAIMTRMEAKSD